MTSDKSDGEVKLGSTPDSSKAAVRYNALSHGIFSREILLEGEDAALLAGLRKKLYTELKPECELEMVLVERILSGIWRLKRVLKSENKCSCDSIDYRYKSWQNFTRYETTIERQIYRAIHELEQLQRARTAAKTPALTGHPKYGFYPI